MNMAMGKAELALRSYGAAGQEVVRSQLQEVEDAWATLLVTAMSCHRYPDGTDYIFFRFKTRATTYLISEVLLCHYCVRPNKVVFSFKCH